MTSFSLTNHRFGGFCLCSYLRIKAHVLVLMIDIDADLLDMHSGITSYIHGALLLCTLQCKFIHVYVIQIQDHYILYIYFWHFNESFLLLMY